MNCQRLQENLFEYLDDSLSPSEKAAAQKHLAECPACREVVQRESQLAQSLSRGFSQTVKPLTLDPETRRFMAAAIERKIAEPRRRPFAPFWTRLILPFTAATAMLLLGFWLGHWQSSPSPTASLSSPVSAPAVLVHISYSVPSYTFHKEGNFVTDTLISDPRIEDGALIAKNSKPEPSEAIYEN